MKKKINKLKKKFLKLDNHTKKLIIISITLLIIALILFLYSLQNHNDYFNKIKKDKNNYLVYSKIEDKDNSKYVPDINIESTSVEQANEDIDNYVSKYLKSKKAIINYDYNINGDYLSVVVRIYDYQKSYAPEIKYKTYNINLKTKELVTNEELLDLFKINEEKVSKIIEDNLENYYTDLVDQGYYIKQECDYKCFLGYRNIDNYLDDVHYYIKNGDLVAYKPFVYYSIFGDEEYFNEDHFEFVLVVTDKN